MVHLTAWLSAAIALVAFIVGLTAREWLPQLQKLQPWQEFDSEAGVMKSHEPASAVPKPKLVSKKLKDELRTSPSNDPVADPETVSDILSASRFMPNSATQKLQHLVDRSGALPRASAAELKMHLAEQLTKVRRFDDAALLREQLLTDRARKKDLSIADFVLATASIAQDWQGAMDYERALATLAKLPLDKLDAGSKSIVTRLEADVHACMGDAITALARFEEAKRLALQAKQPWGLSEELLHVDLLKRVLRAAQLGTPAPPRSVSASLSAAIDAQSRKLLAAGPWVHPQQLPRTFIPGLLSRPWHSVGADDGSFPHLQPVVDLLESATEALSVEFSRLRSNGLLYPETECISDALSGAGAWRTYSVNAAWVDRNETSDCSFDTPVACALLGDIRAAMRSSVPPFHVLRAGYSALASKAHLEPHCGMTNGQLKFHVGLDVPSVGKGKDRRPCAEIRVGNETRAWKQGAVIFFDDSWEHEVWNRCGRERVVLQLVFAHPDLETASMTGTQAANQALLGQVFGLVAAH